MLNLSELKMYIKKFILIIVVSNMCFSANSKNNKIYSGTLPTSNICQSYENLKNCKESQKGKIVRETTYLNNKLINAKIYYTSGRLAKNIFFDDNEKLASIKIFPNIERTSLNYNIELEYYMSFKDGKLMFISDRGGSSFHTKIWECKESQSNNKCNEMNFFNKSLVLNVHPALALPLEIKDFDIFQKNSINSHIYPLSSIGK